MATTFTPRNWQVLIRPTEPPKKTASGIIIPDTHAVAVEDKENRGTRTGTVVSVGAKVMEEPPELRVEPGQLVAFGKYAGEQLKIDGVDHLLMPLSEIHGELTA